MFYCYYTVIIMILITTNLVYMLINFYGGGHMQNNREDNAKAFLWEQFWARYKDLWKTDITTEEIERARKELKEENQIRYIGFITTCTFYDATI